MATPSTLPPLKCHVFVCTHSRTGEPSCAEKNSVALRDALKKACQNSKDPAWRGRVRINASGCLGRCALGITAVTYPEGEWTEQLDARTPEALATSVETLLDQVKRTMASSR